jgi:hypothetical protein
LIFLSRAPYPETLPDRKFKETANPHEKIKENSKNADPDIW